MSELIKNLGEVFPEQQARCREIMRNAVGLGAPGAFLAAEIELALRRADVAAMSGDIIVMLNSYEEMKGFQE